MGGVPQSEPRVTNRLRGGGGGGGEPCPHPGSEEGIRQGRKGGCSCARAWILQFRFRFQPCLLPRTGLQLFSKIR